MGLRAGEKSLGADVRRSMESEEQARKPPGGDAEEGIGVSIKAPSQFSILTWFLRLYVWVGVFVVWSLMPRPWAC